MSEPTPPVLQAAGLTKTYASGDRRIAVLRGVDLLLRAGESVSIRGESGAGKSTLLHLLAGLDAPDAGELRWNGDRIDAARCTAIRNRFLGMIFQSFHLVPELTAEDNVLLPGGSAVGWMPPPGAAPRTCWPGWAWASGRVTCPRSCRGASGSAWRWRAR